MPGRGKLIASVDARSAGSTGGGMSNARQRTAALIASAPDRRRGASGRRTENDGNFEVAVDAAEETVLDRRVSATAIVD